MKKFFILCLMAFVMCVNANAQTFSTTNGLTMTHIIEGTNLNVEESRIACVAFFNDLYNNTNTTQRETYSINNLQYNGSFGTLCSFSMGYWELRDKHEINVSIKDNRLKIDIKTTECELNYTQGYSNSEGIRMWKDLYPLNTDMKITKTNVAKKDCQIAYDNWKIMANDIIKALEKYIRNYKTTTEDW